MFDPNVDFNFHLIPSDRIVFLGAKRASRRVRLSGRYEAPELIDTIEPMSASSVLGLTAS